MINLEGRTALVTGGSRGIGAACSLLLARAGADVAVLYHADGRSARAIAAGVEKEGRRGIIARVDVSDPASCRRAAGEAIRKFGAIDILVNSAGIWERSPVGGMTSKMWDRTISVNLGGTINMIRAVLPSMIANKSGRIINIASTAGQRGESEHSHYAASKGGVIALTKSLGAELISSGIRVNCVSPGWVDTDMVAGTLKKRGLGKKIIESIPIGRVASAEDIAGPVLFLASDLARHIVGANISVNGGSVLE